MRSCAYDRERQAIIKVAVAGSEVHHRMPDSSVTERLRNKHES
jgi:hypothetical protein